MHSINYTRKIRIIEILKRVLLVFLITSPLSLLLIDNIIYKFELSQASTIFLSILGALAAGSITFASIVHSMFLKEETKRIYVKRTFLKNCLLRLDKWRIERNSKIFKAIYDDTQKYWTRELVKTRPITVLTLFADFLPFLLFVISILSWFLASIHSNPNWVSISLIAFYAGIAVFCWDIYVHIYNLRQVESVSVPSEGSGELWIQKIGAIKYEKGLKRIVFEVKNENYLDVTVSYRGKITNGFFSCHLIGEKALGKFFPDRFTYFADYSYPDGLRLTIDSEFDIGILQGNRHFENTLSEVSIPLMLELKVPRNINPMSPREFAVTDNVRRVEIGIYEDPIHLPPSRPKRAKLTPMDFLAERHCIDLVSIDIQKTGTSA